MIECGDKTAEPDLTGWIEEAYDLECVSEEVVQMRHTFSRK
jgi:hypothetical protein